jgi:hypothetical protein
MLEKLFKTSNFRMNPGRLLPMQPGYSQETGFASEGLAPQKEESMLIEKCREYANDCIHRAELVSNPELRERLLNFARSWTERAKSFDEKEEASSVQPNEQLK